MDASVQIFLFGDFMKLVQVSNGPLCGGHRCRLLGSNLERRLKVMPALWWCVMHLTRRRQAHIAYKTECKTRSVVTNAYCRSKEYALFPQTLRTRNEFLYIPAFERPSAVVSALGSRLSCVHISMSVCVFAILCYNMLQKWRRT